MQKPNEFVTLLWEDPSSSFEGWIDLDNMQTSKMETVFSIGWLAREDENHIYLVMDWSEGKGNTVGKIPKSAIKYLKRGKPTGFPAPKYAYPPKERPSADSTQAEE